MKYVKLLLIFAVIALSQVFIMPSLTIKSAFPNLLYIGAVILILNKRTNESIVWSLLGTLVMGLAAPNGIWIYLASFFMIFLIFNIVLNRFLVDIILPVAIVIFFVGSLIFDLVPFLLSDRNVILYLYVALFNTVIGVVMYYFTADWLKLKETNYRI